MTQEGRPTDRQIWLYTESIFDEQIHSRYIYHIKAVEAINYKITGKFCNYLVNPVCKLGEFENYSTLLNKEQFEILKKILPNQPKLQDVINDFIDFIGNENDDIIYCSELQPIIDDSELNKVFSDNCGSKIEIKNRVIWSPFVWYDGKPEDLIMSSDGTIICESLPLEKNEYLLKNTNMFSFISCKKHPREIVVKLRLEYDDKISLKFKGVSCIELKDGKEIATFWCKNSQQDVDAFFDFISDDSTIIINHMYGLEVFNRELLKYGNRQISPDRVFDMEEANRFCCATMGKYERANGGTAEDLLDKYRRVKKNINC